MYNRLGGEKTVDAAVDIFYRKVLADSRIRHFFGDVDMEQQIKKQKAFLTMVFGGPNHYTGRGLRNAHKHLVACGLNDTHFNAVVELLADTLKELSVADQEISEVAAIADSVRNDVLDRSGG